MIVLQQMMVLFIIMMIGYGLNKKNVMTEEVSKQISYIVINIANPAMILSSVISDHSSIETKDLLVTTIVSVCMFAILLVISSFLPKILRIDKKSFSSYKVMTVFSNVGFMGFPIISSLYGQSALLYASLFILPYNILIYTFGIQSFQNGETKVQFWDKCKQILNIGVVACLIAIGVYFTNISFPDWINKCILLLSNLTSPLSMMVIGSSMAVINLKEIFIDRKLLIFSGIKLLIIPIIGTIIVKQFVPDPIICGVTMIMLAVPVGSMTSMLAQQYEGNFELTTKGVVLTTILSVLTIPVVSLFV